jgi:hypothetical protein
MRRRDFIRCTWVLVGGWPIAVGAQQYDPTRRVAILMPQTTLNTERMSKMRMSRTIDAVDAYSSFLDRHGLIFS